MKPIPISIEEKAKLLAGTVVPSSIVVAVSNKVQLDFNTMLKRLTKLESKRKLLRLKLNQCGKEVKTWKHDKFSWKKPAEDLIAHDHEAAMGASFNYLAKSFLIKKGISNEGFNAPANHNSVKTYVCKSAETHRQKLIKNLKKSVQDGQQFSIISDEWTCTESMSMSTWDEMVRIQILDCKLLHSISFISNPL